MSSKMDGKNGKKQAKKKIAKLNVKVANVEKKLKQVPKLVKAIVPAVKGKGDYKADSKTGKWLTKTAGLGGDLISHIFGLGDYNIKYNTLMDAGGPPQFTVTPGNRGTVVCHREFIRAVSGTTSWTNTSYNINPTNANLFPWLSTIATNFERFRFHGLIFEYKKTSGSAVATQALGSIIMSTQYDPNDAPFVSRTQQENYQFTTAEASDVSFLHGCECKSSFNPTNVFYCDESLRSGAVDDARFSQFGTFNIATNGQPTTNECGELWVSYQVELLVPKIGAGTAQADTQWITSGGVIGNGLYFAPNPAFRADSGNYFPNTNTILWPCSFHASDTVAPTYSSVTFTNPLLAGRVLIVILLNDVTAASGQTYAVAQVAGGVNIGATGLFNTTSGTAASGYVEKCSICYVPLLPGAGPWTLYLSGWANYAGVASSSHCVVSLLK